MKVLDLFSGIGGFALGLQRAGFTTQYFCEIDPYCRRVLAKHWPSVPCFEDVRTLHGSDLGPIDLICGGFPCQDISLAGKGAGLSGSRSGLWSEYARLIGEVRPKYVLIENVAALRSRGLDQILREIAALGYDAEWHCIPASAVGAPHRRDRVWIVAYAHSHSDFSAQRGCSPAANSGESKDGTINGAAWQSWRADTAVRRDTVHGHTQADIVAYAWSAGQREGNICVERKDRQSSSQREAAYSSKSSKAPAPVADPNCGQGYFEQSSPMLNALADPHRGRFQQREPQGEQEAELGIEGERCGTDDVAYPHTGFSDRENEEIQSRGNAANNGGADVSNPHSARSQGHRCEHELRGPREEITTSRDSWWAVEPTMGELVNGVSGGLVRFNGRVATKIPNRVNKLRGLGNAVVPQIVEVLGRMIMRHEEQQSK